VAPHRRDSSRFDAFLTSFLPRPLPGQFGWPNVAQWPEASTQEDHVMKNFDHPAAAAAVCLASSLAFCGSASGQTCSGGPDGGIDATGNLCNAVAGFSAPLPGSAIDTSSTTAADGMRPTVVPGRLRGTAGADPALAPQPTPLVDPAPSVGSDPSRWTGARAVQPSRVPPHAERVRS
jgi:hypothetical protein